MYYINQDGIFVSFKIERNSLIWIEVKTTQTNMIMGQEQSP